MAFFTVQVEKAVISINNVIVEADTLEEACQMAIDQADEDTDGWVQSDAENESWVGLVAAGDWPCAWDGPEQVIPVQFTQMAAMFGTDVAKVAEKSGGGE